MSNTKQMVVAVIALALLAWTGALHAEDAAMPVDINADAEAANGDGAGGGIGGGVVAEETGIAENTVTGWVIDAGGWLGMGFEGAEHQQDAVASANMGSPLVILICYAVRVRHIELRYCGRDAAQGLL